MAKSSCGYESSAGRAKGQSYGKLGPNPLQHPGAWEAPPPAPWFLSWVDLGRALCQGERSPPHKVPLEAHGRASQWSLGLGPSPRKAHPLPRFFLCSLLL